MRAINRFSCLIFLLFVACSSYDLPEVPGTSTAFIQKTYHLTPLQIENRTTPSQTATRKPIKPIQTTPSVRPSSTVLKTTTPTPVSIKFSYPLYFLGRTGKEQYGIEQIWRLKTDGVTKQPVTQDIYGVAEFDVSVITGNIAYVSNNPERNQLTIIQPDEGGQKIVIDKEIDAENPNRISDVNWSPDGQYLVYYQEGIQLYSLNTGLVTTVMEDYIEEPLSASNVYYHPETWSPDGKRLLISQRFWEGGNWMVYSTETKELINFGKPYQHSNTSTWSIDSHFTVFTSSVSMGAYCIDLLKYDLMEQSLSSIVPCQFSTEGVSNSSWPKLLRNGELLYFYSFTNSIDVFVEYGNSSWTIMKREASGIPNELSEEIPAGISEVLWDQEGKFAIIRFEDWQAENLAIVSTDTVQPLIFLPVSGKNLRWGPEN